MRVMSWSTWKKKYNLPIIEVSDFTKPWIRTTVEPTMIHNGFKWNSSIDIDCDERKPKQILMEDYISRYHNCELVVYHVAVPTGSYSGYYKYLVIYFK